MTQSIKHSYHVQQGPLASELATRRNRTAYAPPPGPDVMGFPHNEWGFLLSGVKHFQGKLNEVLQERHGLSEGDTQWACDRLVEAQLLIDLIEGPERRRGYFDWFQSVSEEIELIEEKQSPRLL